MGRSSDAVPRCSRAGSSAGHATRAGPAVLLGRSCAYHRRLLPRPPGGDGDDGCRGIGLSVNLLYLNPTGCLGGAERVLLRVLAAVRQADPAARLRLLTCADGPLLERARRLGVEAAA